MNALQVVNRFFPEVSSVKDAKKSIAIEVTKKDCNASKKRNHKECALAVAGKRRFKEITAFDRGASFEPGKYQLTKPGHPLGRNDGGKLKSSRNIKPALIRHKTENIRHSIAEV